MPDTFFQTLAEELESFDTVQLKWFNELVDPTKVARKCKQVVADKISASEMDCLVVVADKWIAELESNEQESREPTLKWVYEKEDSPYEQYPIDLKALGKRFRLLLRLTQLSLRLLACDNKEAAEYMALKQGKELFPKLIQSSEQLRFTDSDQSDVAAIRVFDQWLQRASKKNDIDHSNSFARGVFAFLHPDLRSVRQKLTFEGLYYSPSADETGSETGYVVELTAEAIEDGTGGVYPNPENMILAPLADSTDENRKFEEEVEFAWELAKKRAATNNACNIDVRWSLKLTDLPLVDDSYRLPYPITGNSWNSILTIVFEHLLCGNDLDRGWSLTAAVDDKGSLEPVDGVRAKARAWFSKQENRSSGYLLVTSKDLQDAKDGAGEVIAGDVNQRVQPVDTLDEIKNRLRVWERENYGSVRFDRPRVPEDFTGREDAIENLTHRLNDSESSGRVVVNGERGVGKSALLAAMIDKAFNEGKRPVFYLAGHDKAGIEESLLVKLKRKYQYELSFREKALLTEVLDRVQEYLERENRNEVLYFDEDMCLNESTDGLDQLNERPQIKELLPKLPSRFRYLLMTRNEGTRQSGSECQLSWEALVGDSGRQDVTQYLRKHGRDKLSDHLIHQIDSEQNPVLNFEMIRWCLNHLKSEDKLSEHLRASPDMWLRKPIASSIPESLATKFLKELINKGLCNNVQFLPEHIGTGRDIEKFCLPPRVVDAEQWEQQRKRASEQGRPGFHQRSEADDRYVMMSHEEFLRGDGEDRVVPHQISPPTAAEWHVLEGEPGEGKTTALWLMVARQCRELLERQQCGQPITEASGYRIPLVLPLRTVTTAQQSKRLIDLARDYVLEQMRFLLSEKQKRNQLQQWLDEKIACNEYTLYLDAWDELPDDKEGRRWLKEELLGCRKVPLLLTTRASLSNEARSLNPKPKRYRMVCFGNREIREYVGKFFKDRNQGRELRERSRLSPGPSQLMQLPLLLSLMCMQKRDYPFEPLPRTRTELLKRGLYELFERGDKRRKIKNTRKRRDQQKEQILRHIAWRFHAAEPVPMSEDNLLDVLEQQLPLLTKESPEDEEALLKEFVDDGVLVPVGSDTYRFVLRSFHEYCLAGWIAEETELSKDEATFKRVIQGKRTGWGRPEWGDLTPLTEANWKHVWPLVAGQMGQTSDWLFAVLLERFEAIKKTMSSLTDFQYPLNYGRQRAASDFITFCAAAVSESIWCEKEAQVEESGSSGKAWGLRRLFRHCLNDPAAADALRRRSASALGQIGDDQCREVLIERLNDPATAEDVRGQSAWALGQIGDDQCREVLIERLNDAGTAELVRRRSAWALGQIGDDQCREVLIERLNDPDTAESVRARSVWALGEIGDDQCIKVLIERLNDPDTSVELRTWSARELGEIEDDQCIKVVIERLNDPETSEEVRVAIAWELCDIGSNWCIKVLIERLNDPDTAESVRAQSAWALGQIGDDQCIKVLIERLNDPDTAESVRARSVWALGEIGDDQCIKVLIERLNDPDTAESVRARSVWALGEIGDDQCIKVLIERLNDPDTSVELRTWSARRLGTSVSAMELGEVRDDQCIKVLIERLNDPHTAEEVRVESARALGDIGDDQGFAALVERLNDPETSEEVRLGSAMGVGKIGGDECIKVLIELLNDLDTVVNIRERCAHLLGKIGGRCGEALLERLKDPEEAEEIRKESARALGNIGGHWCINALIERLKDTDEADELRIMSARALGNIGGDWCINALIERLNDTDEADELRIMSARALGNIRGDRCREVLTERLNDSKEAEGLRMWSAYALGLIAGDRSSDILIARIENQYTPAQVRVASVWALGLAQRSSRGCRALNVLVECFKDQNEGEEVRKWSALALGAIGGDRIAKSLREQLIDPDTPKTVQEAITASLGIVSA